MNHNVSLSLKLIDQFAECLRFRLAFSNISDAKILVPYPEIHGLRFVNKATMNESEWYTHLFVSSSWAGFTLQPGKVKTIEYNVRPRTVVSLKEDDCSDNCRWCVELPAGEYLAWFWFHVGEDYFCCDSHYRFKDLLREAESEGAIVWTGEAMSNRLHVVHT